MENKALFLDRDGVINRDNHFVHRIDDFQFLDGIFDLCRQAQQAGYLIIVITNQSGIERGLFTLEDFQLLTNWMKARFSDEGITITDVFFCPSLSGHDRKPDIGLFEKARDRYHVNMEHSFSLGDKERDVEAGRRAHVGFNVLLASTRDASSEASIPSSSADRIISCLREMIPLVTNPGNQIGSNVDI